MFHVSMRCFQMHTYESDFGQPKLVIVKVFACELVIHTKSVDKNNRPYLLDYWLYHDHNGRKNILESMNRVTKSDQEQYQLIFELFLTENLEN